MTSDPTPGTPAAAGYRMPAEWEPHAATWVSFPHNQETWPGHLDAAERAMASAVAALSAAEAVHVNVLDAAHREHVEARLAEAGARGAALHFHHIPTNDAWCRDHGAIFVVRDDRDAPLAALDFGFNAWGGKYPPWDLDDAVATRMAEALDVPRFDGAMVLEGGSVDVNGDGALLTTEQCLLNANRNPDLSRGDIEQRLRDFLGVRQILWLGEGIEGDDTDGHVDDITRFVSRTRVVTAVAPPGDRNHEALAHNRARLAAMRLDDGAPLEIVDLPTPTLHDARGEALPASYANFYIGNGVVLMPGYGGEADRVAAQRLHSCFASREVRTIDCRELIHGFGAFHCLTQQVPDAGAVLPAGRHPMIRNHE
jgi:agmatine deiminase